MSRMCHLWRVKALSNRFLCLFNLILALSRAPLPSDIRILQTHLVYYPAQSQNETFLFCILGYFCGRTIWTLTRDAIGLPSWFSRGRILLQYGRPEFHPWLRRSTGEGSWLATPVAWRIPQTVQSMRSQRVRHDMTGLSDFHFQRCYCQGITHYSEVFLVESARKNLPCLLVSK